MLTVKEDTTLIGVAELRTRASAILNELKKHKVILTKRNMPVGIIVDYEEYEKMERLMDLAEDILLGNIAKQRLERKNKKSITLEEAERRVGLR